MSVKKLHCAALIQLLKRWMACSNIMEIEPHSLVRKASGIISKLVSEYDQEIPQSQTADNPVAPLGRAAQPSQDTRKTN